MQGISTITQKGQVAIPKAIRDYFKLHPSDKLHFFVENNKIVAEPMVSVKDMRGFVMASKTVSKEDMKQVIQDRVAQKYANRS